MIFCFDFTQIHELCEWKPSKNLTCCCVVFSRLLKSLACCFISLRNYYMPHYNTVAQLAQHSTYHYRNSSTNRQRSFSVVGIWQRNKLTKHLRSSARLSKRQESIHQILLHITESIPKANTLILIIVNSNSEHLRSYLQCSVSPASRVAKSSPLTQMSHKKI